MAKLCCDVIATGNNVFCTGTTVGLSQGSISMEGTDWDERGMNSDVEEISKVCVVYAGIPIDLTCVRYAA